MILQAIKAYWDYQKSDRPEGHIGMSGIGHCGRQLAYTHHQCVGMPLDWRAKVIFDDGDLHHEQIRKALRDGLSLTKSCYQLYCEEEEVELGVLKGHIDGMLVHESEKCGNTGHRDMLLEVKSMNDRGFSELKRAGKLLSFEYRSQVSAYLRATGVDDALILVKNKNNGDMFTVVYQIEKALLDDRLDVLAKVKESKTPEDVEREYSADENGELPWQCNYCPFTFLCWRHEGVTQHGAHFYKIGQQTATDVPRIVMPYAALPSEESEKKNGTEVANKEKPAESGKEEKESNKKSRKKK